MKKLYYIPYITQEGGWTRTNGFLISDDFTLISKKREEMPKDNTNLNPFLLEINYLEVSNSQMDMFLTKSVDGVLWGDEFELNNYRKES